ncbi:hypothetical protein ACWDOP_02605 [Nocardia sp. NPDC003693]
MTTSLTGRFAAGTALLAAAVALSTGTAAAAPGPVGIWVGGGPDLLACEATGQTCQLTAYVRDMAAPVTISVNGQALISEMPVPSPGTSSAGKLVVVWTPKKAGNYVIDAKQGAASETVTVRIIDNASPEALWLRAKNFTGKALCDAGSSAVGSGVICMPDF